ncbi:Histone-lysine N-methyltransferase [Bertholletia excelsa]
MVSKSSDTATKHRKYHAEQTSDPLGNLTNKIHQLKKQIQAERVVSIREKLEKNSKKLEGHVSVFVSAATSRNDISLMETSDQDKMLASRIENPLWKFGGFHQGTGDKDYVNSQEVVYSTSSKLPYIEKIPPYTTWIFLDRNQRMADDQSVVGRRRIYYDPHGSEALICSDSEEDIAENEEEKHEFSEGEDRILWMVFQEHGLGEEVLNIVSQHVGGSTLEIQERCNILEQNQEKQEMKFKGYEECVSEKNSFLGKGLNAALDSFDNLFCRRCLVFDCRLHGCSQSLIYQSEKLSYSSESDDDGKPCSDQCYLRLKVVNDLPEVSPANALHKNESKSSDEEGRTAASTNAEETGKRKVPMCIDTTPEDLTSFLDDGQSSSKKQKKLSAQNVVAVAGEGVLTADSSCSEGREMEFEASHKNEFLLQTKDAACTLTESVSDKATDPVGISGNGVQDSATCEAKGNSYGAEEPSLEELSNSRKEQEILCSSEWKPLEKELYLKGIEMFGRNSCLIARNLLSGLKTCIEVSSYMYDGGDAMLPGAIDVPSSFSEDNRKTDADFVEREIPTRSRLLRRRGRARKLKYSWKSAGHPSMWKRIADGKNQSCKQYTPCGCQSMCGKQCPCQHNGTCCEKYCGCSKSCKNRFRGCHCAKSQCRSRQCPCFAAGRECDPDVCRNCWVSCGDGSLGEPPRRGDGQCGNMRLLLRQQQRILLAKSEVAGWGAFLKNPVNKNDYLGEYTGELISHREADKRGKIYDRANSSFLFDLNDQYVLDAYRKGDKLKFANHSSNPNCYAKVMLVAGDHRVGIFAKEHIEASEELFYDYRYGPDQAPAWARKPEGSKGDDSSVSQGRAKKHQSH